MNASCYVTGEWPRSLTQGLGHILMKTVPEGRAHILHFNSLSVCARVSMYTYTHIAFSLSLFLIRYLSWFPFCPLTCLTHLCAGVCLCCSVKFPLHPPPFFSLSLYLFILLPLLSCWFWPVMCHSAGVRHGIAALFHRACFPGNRLQDVRIKSKRW